MLKEILWQNRSRWHTLGAAAGIVIGLVLLLLTTQIFLDFRNIINPSSDQDDRYVIINKKVNLLNTFGVKNNFSDEEINNLKNQPFVSKVGNFVSNEYKVSASSPRFGFYTELFFESVPDEFVDLDKSEFVWKEGDPNIPVILSRDYLALYNFGFAPSQGLPQFTPNTIKKVGFNITLTGNGISKTFRGRIIGFSERINSIIVPGNFMEWSNARFGSGGVAETSRLVLSVNNPYDPAFESFMQENGYEISRGRFIGGKLRSLVYILIAALLFISLIIVLLSALVFYMGFELVVARSSDKIKLLSELGYHPKSISKFLKNQLLKLLGILAVIGSVIFIVVNFIKSSRMNSAGFESTSFPNFLTWLVMLILILTIYYFISSRVKNLVYQNR